ncbi:hypothetical protein SEA_PHRAPPUCCINO_36 [Mycobacterium phage Phrappuccino]|uniref:Uncharacterized protein n=1 Tax=Mycobacterium phage Phrappuccino TaxID=2591223 RepID=A0A514DDM9_9CAUD|nr:hypothetical protein KHQ87_gp036 [Mycobacterium phage Phrappuccino]QDH91714.1 hypothetical protein SEA_PHRAPPUCCINO_36 [Mycobacterium phage Phrappuccino]QIQ63157.1 hypothetical protein SEA_SETTECANDELA_36 [Mycobacterium phage Settecandela]
MGDTRRRSSRHVTHVTIMLALAIIAFEQLVIGPKGSVVVLAMPEPVQRLFACTLLAGSVSALLSAVWVEFPTDRRSWLPPAAFLDLGGMIGCTTALFVYSFNLRDTVQFWSTSLGVVLSFLGVACGVRAYQAFRFIRRNFHLMKRVK